MMLWSFAAPAAPSAPPPTSSGGIYLRCTADNESYDSVGSNDVYVDFKAKTFTNPAFNTVRPFRESGPNLVAEDRQKIQEEEVLMSSWTINRYTLRYTYLVPALKTAKAGICRQEQSQLAPP